MEKQILTVSSNGVDFYCEKRGSGPVLVFVPDGINDCEHFSKAGDILAEEFTVLTFDMRGGTRAIPKEDQRVTPKLLAEDVVGIIKALKLEPASIYGCSSGGQAVLAIGKYFPEVAKNLIIHEASLMLDCPLPDAGYSFFKTVSTYAPYCNGFIPEEIAMVGNKKKWDALGPEFLERIKINHEYWAKWYLGSVDRVTYTKEELEKMPNLEFSIGTWSPSWLTYSNIVLAERANRPYTWLDASHNPQVTGTEEFVDFIRETCKKYI
jgi:pimeloyl-ACP methyl ester carboxylesterase